MAGRITSLPGHGSLDDLEQFIRDRFQRDGGVAVRVPLDWRSRCQQLRRLHKRFRGAEDIQAALFDSNRYSYLAVGRPDERVSAWSGWMTD